MFGKIKLQKIFKKKISKLKIDSEDFANLSGTVGNKNNFINITLDYFSNIKIRKCKIYFDNFFIIADLNKNLLIKHYKNKKIIKKFKKTNTIYLMHHEILKKKNQFISCNLKQGLHLLKSLEI